jgi:hypothetical protein
MSFIERLHVSRKSRSVPQGNWSVRTATSSVTDWAEWATSVGTLVLAGATFAAIRSSNRSARSAERSTRIAERTLLANLRPLLVVAQPGDPGQQIQFADGCVIEMKSGEAVYSPRNGVIYLALPLRNVGTGIAHLLRYRLEPESENRVRADPLGPARHRRGDPPPDPRTFAFQQRDLYIAPGESGFWQAALRDRESPLFIEAGRAHHSRGRLIVDVLYGDLEDGQPTVTRFVLLPNSDHTWRCTTAHHWRDLPDLD